MKTPEQIAEEVAGSHFDTYQDSSEEVNHPEGQPIVETWPALRACIAAAIEADRAQRDDMSLPSQPGTPEPVQLTVVSEAADGDDEPIDLLYCSKCNQTLQYDEIHAVLEPVTWSIESHEYDVETQTVTFDSDVERDLTDTSHFTHGEGGHLVLLPEGWGEQWY